VLDAMPQGATRPAAGSGPLVAGRAGTSHTAWPAAATRPTRDRPQLSLLLVPKNAADQGTAPTWVFPFNAPPAPGAGDNQALAINTTDGSTVYDVAFALVWVTDGTADNRNEAYALASCQNCATVAIGFQVVLVVGQANVVVPRNIAVAVNYACVECVTVALAKQLVITLPGALSDAGSAELARVWSRLTELAAHLQNVSLQQLQAELTRVETDILDIIRREAPPGTTAPSGPPTGTTTLPGAPATGTAPAVPPSAGETATPSPSEPTTSQPPTTTTEPDPTTSTPAPTTA
jgi:putative peptide zinc metalloprotease protein